MEFDPVFSDLHDLLREYTEEEVIEIETSGSEQMTISAMAIYRLKICNQMQRNLGRMPGVSAFTSVLFVRKNTSQHQDLEAMCQRNTTNLN